MQRIYALLVALLFCLPCSAQVPSTHAGLGTPAAGGVAFSITRTDKKADSSNTADITYNAGGNPSIGSPNGGNRIIVVTLSCSKPTGIGANSLKVNGVFATKLGARFSFAGAGMWSISDAAAGTTALSSATVEIIYGGNVTNSEIGVYVVTTSTPAQTPVESDNANFSSASSIASTITIPAGGGGIGVIGTQDSQPPTTWTAMTADYDDAIGTFQASATHTASTGSTTFTATFNAAVTQSFQVVAGFAP